MKRENIYNYLKSYKVQKRNKGAFFSQKSNMPKAPYKLHRLIKDDYHFWQEGYFNEQDIKGRTYVPYSLEDVTPKADELIAQISKYFNCITIWDRVMVPGTVEGLNTVTIYGYPYSQHLCYYYISRTLASLDYLKYNVTQWKRKRTRKLNRKGYKKKPEHMNATQMGQRYYDLTAGRITESWATINSEMVKDEIRVAEIYKYVDKIRGLNYRAYHYKGIPKIENAFATKGKFQIKRIINETQ